PELRTKPHQYREHSADRHEQDQPADERSSETVLRFVLVQAEQHRDHASEHDAGDAEHEPPDACDQVCDPATTHAHARPPPGHVTRSGAVPGLIPPDHPNLPVSPWDASRLYDVPPALGPPTVVTRSGSFFVGAASQSCGAELE